MVVVELAFDIEEEDELDLLVKMEMLEDPDIA